ncbi:MAG: 16S rRNA (cytidine(1402)-2'-O)-methyltransferase [Chloroflexota bacterium]|nr:MAG: 16S rRNA (cytidine(1402)-2'-O)-methyltransferase [Chloroflexota bacterium]
MSTLYLVATPIGNLEDITYRAVRILKEVTIIAAEDTRTSGGLLKRYGISTPLTSYHEYNKSQKTAQLLAHLAKGDVALISDAGTPGINDPGFVMVNAALKTGHHVSPIPGPSAPIAALTASGLPSDSFLYLGYLPRKKSQRQKLLREVNSIPHTLIFLETPHRLCQALDDIAKELGERDIAIARELTKLHEEIFRGKISAAQQHFSEKEPRGEITLVIAGQDPETQKWSLEKLQHALKKEQLIEGNPPSKIAKAIAKKSGWKRSEVYNILQEL